MIKNIISKSILFLDKHIDILMDIVLWLIIMMFVLTLEGCKEIINTSAFYQTNYENNCLQTAKTRDELTLCYVYQDRQEKNQNNITNNLISSK